MRNCLSFEFFRAWVFSKPKSSSISAFRQETRRNRRKIVIKNPLLMMNKKNIDYSLTLQRYWNPLCHNFARVWRPPKRLPLLCRSALTNGNLWMVFNGWQSSPDSLVRNRIVQHRSNVHIFFRFCSTWLWLTRSLLLITLNTWRQRPSIFPRRLSSVFKSWALSPSRDKTKPQPQWTSFSHQVFCLYSYLVWSL